MERIKKNRVEFPSDEEVASVFASLYRTSRDFLKDKKISPKIALGPKNAQGKISTVTYSGLDSDTVFDLYHQICSVRPHAWGHVEAFMGDETATGTVTLYEELAYVPSR